MTNVRQKIKPLRDALGGRTDGIDSRTRDLASTSIGFIGQPCSSSSSSPFLLTLNKLSTKKVDSTCNCRLFIWNKLSATACRVNINQITFMDVSSRNI